jgi:anti-sigma B factor antagonist
VACTARVRHEGDVAIVDLSGRITLGDGWGTLRDTVKRLISQGDRLVLLNMKDVSYIDSAGLGELVGSYATMTNQGGQMKLVYAENKVRDVLMVTRLYGVFEHFADEAAALQSFATRVSGAG